MICLPKELTSQFLQAIKSRSLNIKDLSEMSSDERRSVFEEVVGKDNAKEVNTLFEQKMTLKNQQTGMINFIKEVGGLKPEQERSIIDRINKAEEVLKPADIKSFLADYAAKKVGAEVTTEEAAKIADLAKQASQAKQARNANTTPETIREYGKTKNAFGEYLNSIKPGEKNSFTKVAANILSIPKSALTSVLHFSAPFVQGWGMLSTGSFWKGTGEMFKYFMSEDNYKNAQADISGHPDFDLAKSSGLGITSIDAKLSDREEAIQSNLLQKAGSWVAEKTHTPDFLRASSRAFTGFLNYVRFNRFEDILTAARLKGEDVSKGSKNAKDIASVVNNFTGRGSLGRANQLTPELNSAFFSPRKMIATAQMFNPVEYFKLSSTARMAALRQLSGSLIITGSILGLARLSGASVDWTPYSSNFGKIKIGNTSFDMTGGNAAWVRLLAQIVSGKIKSSTGATTNLGGIIQKRTASGKMANTPFTANTRSDQALSYLRSHLAPVAGIIADWMAGNKNAIGQPTSVKGETENALTPLVLQEFINLYKNDPKNTMAMIPALSSIFGVSMQSTAPVVPKPKK